jgi:two-component system OmpR family response regulator
LHKATVLTVDDDDDLQFVMRQYLEPQGYRIVSAQSGAEFMDKLDIAHPDIILLDLGLPDHDGLSLLSSIRSKSNSPVIVVSGRKETSDRIVGLEMGADDYLVKPFAMHELAARIKAVLRRSKDSPGNIAANEAKGIPAEPKSFSFNGWTLDRLQYQLFDKDGKTPGLTSGEFKLLEALLRAPHHVLSRENLFELTRQGKFDVYDRVIDTQIARIRKKIGDDPQNPTLIKTVRGIGYMFCGQVNATE